jgi:hypothetical protein
MPAISKNMPKRIYNDRQKVKHRLGKGFAGKCSTGSGSGKLKTLPFWKG